MRTELFWLLSFGGFAAMSLLCGLVAWPQLAAVWPSIQEAIDRFRRLPPLAKLVLMLFVGAFVVYGSTKTNQVDESESEVVGVQSNLQTCAFGLMSVTNILCTTTTSDYDYPPPTVTPEDIARGWQLWEVRTNCNVSYTMPEGATLATNWWVRGAYEDVKPIDFGSWRFPFGTNDYSSLWAFSWGKVRFALGDINAEIVAVGAPMSAVSYRSRLWSAADTNDSRFITWENFALNRDTNTPVNVQIELRTTGDFVTRSNEVESVYRRIDPDDWDDDGWRNDDDPDPYVWEEYWDSFWQELPDGANESAYCWIEIRPRWHSYIEFVGDGPSDLDDPYIYGKAGETYCVQLLIGKTYDVESTQPLEIVAKSDERIEVSNVEPDSFTVVWPVTFTVAEGRAPESRPRLGATWNDGGKSFYVMPNPPWLRGTVIWTDDICCGVWGDGTNFTYACDNECTCEGCTAYGDYWYEGYALPVWGIFCGCHYVEDQGPAEIVDISFDKSAAIYEESYTNRPGEVVHPFPSNVVLRCEARGGTYGGWLTVTLNDKGMEKIVRLGGDALPNNVHVQAGEVRTFETVYTPQEPSDDVGDIVASATFTENFSNERYSNSASLTSLKVELTTVYEAPENPNPHRHIFGVGEKVKLRHWPESASVTWSLLKEGLLSRIDDGADCDKVFTETLSQEIPALACLRFGDAEYVPATGTVDPTGLVCRVAAWNGMCLPKGRAGGQGMDLTLYVEPMYVSFRGIDIYEAPCTNALPLVGYFDTTSYEGEVSHTFDAGAGFWHHVKAGNYWSIDNVTSAERVREWSDGEMTWNIPIGWREPCENGDWPRGVLHYTLRRLGSTVIKPQNKYKQIYTLNSLGETGVSKHGHSIVRTTNDVIRLDGVIVHEGCDK